MVPAQGSDGFGPPEAAASVASSPGGRQPVHHLAKLIEIVDVDCAGHGIVSDIEMIAADAINEAYERMLRSDVKYRFVIDVGTMGVVWP